MALDGIDCPRGELKSGLAIGQEQFSFTVVAPFQGDGRPAPYGRFRLKREVKRDRLVPNESKTGPRHVLLGGAARELLDRLSKTRSGDWVFPGTAREGHMNERALYLFWRRVRD